jgi:hypothetical protein
MTDVLGVAVRAVVEQIIGPDEPDKGCTLWQENRIRNQFRWEIREKMNELGWS